MRTACLILSLLFVLPANAEKALELIELSHRRAEEMIPLLRPHLSAETSLSGQGNRILVRGEAGEIAAASALAARLDTPPRTLRIAVRQSAAAGASESGGSLNGRSLRVYSSEGAARQSQQQSLTALEGRPARIHTGVAVPVRVDEVVLGTHGIGARSSTEFIVLESGFYATARTQGDRVEIDIATDQAGPAGAGGGLERQTIVTSLRGRLGEWLPLGGSASGGNGEQRGLVHRSEDARSRHSQIWLKVELAD